jgi:L-ascorbate oxidase
MATIQYLLLILLGTLIRASIATLQIHDSTFVPDFILHITYDTASVACRSKPIVLVNDTSPGPPIHLKENVTSWIRVYNDIDNQNLTIHWHGLSQYAAPFSDGTPQASQWPIPPNHFFDYEIRPAIGEAGTYFYHSHVLFQAVSAAGPLIVEEASGHPPYIYDEERVLMLSEFYNQTDEVIVDGLIGSPFRFSGETEAILLNGKSYPAEGAEQVNTPPPWSPPTNDAGSCGPEVIKVNPSTAYRFRTIGGMALGLVAYQFQHHDNITVIAADGQYTKPVTTNRIQIGPGQRFDFLLQTKTKEEVKKLGKSMFWVQMELRYRPANVTSYAILQYDIDGMKDEPIPESPPTKRPIAITDDIQDWLEYELTPLQNNGFPDASEVTRTVYLTSAQLDPFNSNPPTSQTGSSNHSYWTTNNRTWTEENQHLNGTSYNTTGFHVGTPYLVNVYLHGEDAIPNYEIAVKEYGGWDPTLNVYAAKVGEVIDIVLRNQPNGILGGFDNHPW